MTTEQIITEFQIQTETGYKPTPQHFLVECQIDLESMIRRCDDGDQKRARVHAQRIIRDMLRACTLAGLPTIDILRNGIIQYDSTINLID